MLQSKTLISKGLILSASEAVKSCILCPWKIFLLLPTNKKKPQGYQDWSFTSSQTPRPWTPVQPQDILGQLFPISKEIAVYLCLGHLLIPALSTNAVTLGACAIENQEQILPFQPHLFFNLPVLVSLESYMSLCIVDTVYWRITYVFCLFAALLPPCLSLFKNLSESASVERFRGEA